MERIVACGARADVRKLAAATAPVEPRGHEAVGLSAGGGMRSLGASRPEPLTPALSPSEGERGRMGRGRTEGNEGKQGKRESLLEQAIRKGPEILQRQFPHVYVPKLGEDISFQEWYWRELKEGGVLQAYLEREKATSARRMRRVAKAMHGWQQNNQSEYQLKAAVPLREYFRWKAVDPHFWEDDKNLKSLRRDNPDAVVRA